KRSRTTSARTRPRRCRRPATRPSSRRRWVTSTRPGTETMPSPPRCLRVVPGMAWAFAALLWAGWAFDVGAAPAPRTEGLELRLSLDREEYYEREPIFAHWTLTNAGRKPLRVMKIAHLWKFRFECRREGEDKEFLVYTPPAQCVDEVPKVTLEHGSSLKHWSNVRGGYVGLRGPGTFSIRAVCEVHIYPKGKEEPAEKLVVRSDFVKFSVVRAGGEELKAIRLIADRLPKEHRE